MRIDCIGYQGHTSCAQLSMVGAAALRAILDDAAMLPAVRI